MANTWNQSGTTWNTGRWGTTEAITSGWGADAWNTGGSWGQATDELVSVTGVSSCYINRFWSYSFFRYFRRI